MEKNISLAYQEETNYYADKVRLNSNTLDVLDYIVKWLRSTDGTMYTGKMVYVDNIK